MIGVADTWNRRIDTQRRFQRFECSKQLFVCIKQLFYIKLVKAAVDVNVPESNFDLINLYLTISHSNDKPSI